MPSRQIALAVAGIDGDGDGEALIVCCVAGAGLEEQDDKLAAQMPTVIAIRKSRCCMLRILI